MAVTRSVMVTSLPSSPAARAVRVQSTIPLNKMRGHEAHAWPGLSMRVPPRRWATSTTFASAKRVDTTRRPSRRHGRKIGPEYPRTRERRAAPASSAVDATVVALRRLHRLRVLHDRSGRFVPMRGTAGSWRWSRCRRAPSCPSALPAPSTRTSRGPRTRSRGSCCARYQRRQADICRRHLPPDGRILEIGCATGDVLAELAGEYPVVHGIELSEDALRRRPGPGPGRLLRHARGVSRPTSSTTWCS